MRILALADRCPDIPLEDLLAARPELVVCCGDLERRWLEPLRDTDIPAVGVYGNHCLGGYLEDLGVENLHGHAIAWPSGFTMAGLEGCPRYKVTPRFQYDEEEVAAVLEPLPAVDLFVTHCPPRGVNDTSDPTDVAHQGWRALRSHIRRRPSRWLIHGHTYPTRELERFGGIEVFYVSGHRLIEIDANLGLRQDATPKEGPQEAHPAHLRVNPPPPRAEVTTRKDRHDSPCLRARSRPS